MIKGINENVICKSIPTIKLPKVLQQSPWRKLAVWKKKYVD